MAHSFAGWFAALVLAGPAQAAPPARVAPTAMAAAETASVRLPRFSPDSRTLAYVADLRLDELPLSEVRAITLADGGRRTLLGREQSQGAATYSAYAVSLDWLDANQLLARVSDGDVDHTRFRLDRRRTGAVAETYVEAGEENMAAPADPALAAIVPGWQRTALDGAVAAAVRSEGRGLLLQKRHANEDQHVWWLDTQAGTARIIVPEVAGERSELRGGFAFAGQLLFALRQGGAVRVFRLGPDGEVGRVPGAGSDSIPGAAGLAHAVSTNIGSLEPRRCGPEACWALLHLRDRDWSQVQVLRLDKEGAVEIVRGLDGLQDFDLSPDLRHLAATIRDGNRDALVIYRVLAF